MSNKPTVGDIYGKIVNEVIESSRTAFEEDGIDMSALDLLQQEWQHKLSDLKVAGLPWNPTPTAVKQQELLPGNAKPVAQNGNINPLPQASLNPSPPLSRPEAPSYPKPVAPQYPASNFRQGQPDSAEARAAALLNQKYGPRASAQIAELQGGQRLPQIPADGQVKQEDRQPGVTYIKQEAQSTLPNLDNYHAGLAQHSPPIKTDQSDGPGDALDEWKIEYARRKEAFQQARARSDRLIRNHVQASQQQLEGGGLMVPLEERSVFPAGTILTAAADTAAASQPRLSRAQRDGPGDDDDDDLDENAINSDLDDPEDAADDIEGEETTGNVMLCTYDKVQRVKNKWKCTLKDGIMGIDGQDYLFHKGQGEFEW